MNHPNPELIGKETLPQPQPQELPVTELNVLINPLLDHGCRTALCLVDAIEANQDLTIGTFSDSIKQGVLSGIREELITASDDTKVAILDSIDRDFPDKLNTGDPLPTPRAYARSYDLSGAARANLVATRKTVVADKKESLIDAISAEHPDFDDYLPTEDELRDVFDKHAQNGIDKLRNVTLTTILEALKNPDAHAGGIRIKLNQTAGLFSDSSLTIDATAWARSDSYVESHEEMFNLTSLLESYPDFERKVFVAHIVETLKQAKIEQVKARTVEMCRTKVAQAIAELGPELTEAYAHTSRTREPIDTTDTSSEHDVQTDTPVEDQHVLTVPTVEEVENKNRLIGTDSGVSLELPWLAKNEQAKVSFITQGNQTIAFCRALPPALASMSAKLRRNNRFTHNISSMIEKLQKNEFAESDGVNPVFVANQGPNIPSQILLAQARRSNAEQLFFTKIGIDNYPGLKDRAIALGHDPDGMQLLIVLGETDYKSGARAIKHFKA
jgi:hypothetical protein